MHEFYSVMALPFMACLILAGMYAYLGFHVIEREVIFVDLALAQIAVLGASLSIALGNGFDSPLAFWSSLGFTVLGAVIFSTTRFKDRLIPQEAIIGITYAVSAALLIMVLSRSGEGDEHIKQALAGNILLVSWQEIIKMAVVCAAVGAVHVFFRRQFFLISRDPQRAFDEGLNVRLWDFIFYVTFGLVVTSSVKTAGVLLVFSFLVVPAVCAMLLSSRLITRLIIGWIVGAVAGIMGLALSYYCDYPTGASIVCVFGLLLVVLCVVRMALRPHHGSAG